MFPVDFTCYLANDNCDMWSQLYLRAAGGAAVGRDQGDASASTCARVQLRKLFASRHAMPSSFCLPSIHSPLFGNLILFWEWRALSPLLCRIALWIPWLSGGHMTQDGPIRCSLRGISMLSGAWKTKVTFLPTVVPWEDYPYSLEMLQSSSFSFSRFLHWIPLPSC